MSTYDQTTDEHYETYSIGAGHKMSRSHVSREKFRTLDTYNRDVMTDFTIRTDTFV